MRNAETNSEPVASRSNPYLTGLHAPMRKELTIENLPATGTIPHVLDGRYLRMGPNPMAPNSAKYHWFSGDGTRALRESGPDPSTSTRVLENTGNGGFRSLVISADSRWMVTPGTKAYPSCGTFMHLILLQALNR
jgi:hypothetical protein